MKQPVKKQKGNLQRPKPKTSNKNQNLLKDKSNKKQASNQIVKQVRIKNITKYVQLYDTKTTFLIYGILIILTFGLYANTIPFGYVFDDPIVITKNNFTKQGVAGIPKIMSTDSFAGIFGEHGGIIAGGRYRPFSVVTFALEWELFATKVEGGSEKEGNPYISHFINILLYAITVILLYKVLAKIFSQSGIYQNRHLNPFDKKPKWFLSIPFIATVLFLVHPTHTEIIANIKERDDILTLLFSLWAMHLTLKHIETKKILYLISSFIVFFLAFLSKENAVLFVAIIPLSIFFFTKVSFKDNFISIIPLLLATIIFMIIRQKVLGVASENNIPNKLMNDPFLNASVSEKFGTIFYSLWLYIKLLFVPHPLTVDYYPKQIPLIGIFNFRSLLPIFGYIALGIYALIKLPSKSIISYSIWVYLIGISIFSNILFPIGTILGERFLYMASIGFCVAIAYLLLNKLPEFLKEKKQIETKVYSSALIPFLIIIISLFSYKTIDRNFDWVDDFTLFYNANQVSTGSAKSYHVMGELYMYKALEEKNKNIRDSLLDLSVKNSKIGIEIHPKYVRCLHNLGTAIFERNNADYEKAMHYFVETIKNQPYYTETYMYIFRIFNYLPTNTADQALNAKNLNFKIKSAKQIQTYATNHYEINSNLGTFYLLKNDLDSAFIYLDRATRIQSKKSKAGDYNNLAVIYHRKKNLKKAIEMFEKAASINPKNTQYPKNIIATCQAIGDMQKAQQWMEKLQKMTQK